MNSSKDVFLAPERALTPAPLGDLREQLDTLCRLIANMTESYTAALFVSDEKRQVLQVGGVQTLSREFLHECAIPFGSGLIGWTAENGVRISVTPFEHDATTLLCYGADQTLKSFVALPILDDDGSVLGVISCDSKKSYAFAKLTEKILGECAHQARCLIKLNQKLQSQSTKRPINGESLEYLLEELRTAEREDDLLKTVAHLPQEILNRDALVVMTLSHGGVGKGKFYSAANSNQSTGQHRLLELVCNHQKMICAERSVHALPTNQTENRSFLSVPFRVLDREAGSINVLSQPQGFFEPEQINLLEKIAGVIGREVERLRLRDRFVATNDSSGILSWKHFAIRANLTLAEARAAKQPLSLIRVAVNNLAEIEDFSGVDVATHVMQRIVRLVDQIKGQGGVACYLYGSHVIFLTSAFQTERLIPRLETLIKRFDFSEFPLANKPVGIRLGDLLLKGTRITAANFPEQGDTLTELTAMTLRAGEAVEMEVTKNVGNWA